MDYDVIIIGGSYAGLAAGLQLARARRRILVVDEGMRRNRFAATSHGFLGQDGRDPALIAADGREQLLRYPRVEWLSARALSAERAGEGFVVDAGHGDHRAARRLILATGVTDRLPAIPGLAERWGKSIFTCPYCHGYELNQGQIGVLASSPLSMHHALMLPDWGPTTLFSNGAFEPDDGQRAQLAERGVSIEPQPVREIAGAQADVVLQDGRVVPCAGLFTLTETSIAGPFAQQLGCALDDGPFGPILRVDETQETSVPGVFACGDAARAMASVTMAVAAGAMAGVGVHRSLIFGQH